MLLLSSTLVILKSTTTYPQIYPKYTEHSSHIYPSSIYLYYPMLYPLIRSSQQLNSHNTLFISYCIDHDSTASSHNLYGSNYHGQNCKQTQLNVKCNYLTHSNLHKRTRTDIQSKYPGKLSSSCLNSDQCLLCKINISLSTQVERPKAVGVPTTCKYPDANTPSVPTPLRIAFNTTPPIPEPSRLTQHNSTYRLQPPPPSHTYPHPPTDTTVVTYVHLRLTTSPAPTPNHPCTAHVQPHPLTQIAKDESVSTAMS